MIRRTVSQVHLAEPPVWASEYIFARIRAAAALGLQRSVTYRCQIVQPTDAEWFVSRQWEISLFSSPASSSGVQMIGGSTPA
jgi:hypothetical protein